MGWLAAGDSYEVALVDGRVVARSAAAGTPAGQERKQVRSLPAEIRDRPEVIELQRFAEWLDRHAAECAAQVHHLDGVLPAGADRSAGPRLARRGMAGGAP